MLLFYPGIWSRIGFAKQPITKGCKHDVLPAAESRLQIFHEYNLHSGPVKHYNITVCMVTWLSNNISI